MTDKQKQHLISLVKAGVPIKEIAAETGSTVDRLREVIPAVMRGDPVLPPLPHRQRPV